MSKLFILNIFYALIADAVWGLAYVIPNLLPNYTAVEITFGRYFVYGIFSIIMLLFQKQKSLRIMNTNIWRNAFLFSFCGNIGYYFFLVLSIKLTGATIATLIIGMLSITTSLYGNFINHEFSFKKLILPIFVVIIGVLILNYASLNRSTDTFNIYGVIYGLIALCLWTWYAVSNACFLKENAEITSQMWSTITGTTTLCLIPFFILMIKVIMPDSLILFKLISPSNIVFKFWRTAVILGIVVSWIGTVFWNKASNALPISLAGEMTVGETAFGLTYSFIIEGRLPHIIELISIVIILTGIVYYIHTINCLNEGDEKYNVENEKSC
ncbi:DMT family transporter [Clostridium sp. BJN0013]|uniref:DMT family transporter n=1 Tax=Clostridium sp. BJN0013 TaxID=3236840 RepID=UPI0034C63330